MIAYHVDRLNSLEKGRTFSLQNINIPTGELKYLLDSRFPDGMSNHGINYYVLGAPKSRPRYQQNALIENVFEYERRLYHPHRPSRLQSIFASETVEESKIWMNKLTTNESDIPPTLWEVEYTDPPVKLDSSFLYINPDPLSFLQAADFANKYWSGNASDNPLWELLLTGPVRVIQQITL